MVQNRAVLGCMAGLSLNPESIRLLIVLFSIDSTSSADALEGRVVYDVNASNVCSVSLQYSSIVSSGCFVYTCTGRRYSVLHCVNFSQ